MPKKHLNFFKLLIPSLLVAKIKQALEKVYGLCRALVDKEPIVNAVHAVLYEGLVSHTWTYSAHSNITSLCRFL